MNSLLYHEKKQHGTNGFPVEYHFVDKSHPRYVMPYHWHKEWELLRVVEGTLCLQVDQALYTAQPGDVILVRDSMLHGGVQQPCVYECLLFDLHELFKSFQALKPQLRPVYRLERLPRIFFAREQCPELCRCAAQLMACCTPTGREPDGVEYDRLSLVGGLCRLFGQILRDGHFAEQPQDLNHRTDWVKSVLEYIEQHYSGPITLTDLAAHAGLSPNYFCRVFKQVMHQSPMDYVLHYRIGRAADLLANTGMPVTEVSMECGFNDYSFFIRVFRRLMGITPKQFQLQHAARR